MTLTLVERIEERLGRFCCRPLRLGQQLRPSVRDLQEVPAPIVGITPAPFDQPAPFELVDEADDDRRVDGEAAGDVLLGQRFGRGEGEHQELPSVESDRAERFVKRLLRHRSRPCTADSRRR